MTIVADDGSERLVPAVAQYIRRFDLVDRRLILDAHE